MSHDVFTRKDALRQDIPLSTPPNAEQIAAARRTIAANSNDVEECSMFLDMLGLLPKANA